MKKHNSLAYFTKRLTIIVGIVLIWRGVWIIADAVDVLVFGGSHWLTGLVGVVAGILLLYLPDHDLKELDRL